MTSTDSDAPLDIELPLDSQAGPAVRITRQKADALVDAALEEARHAPPSRRRRRPLWLLVAAVVGIAASAAAASAYLVSRSAKPLESAPSPERGQDLPAATLPKAEPSPPEEQAGGPGDVAPATPAPSEARLAPPPAKSPEDWLEQANALRARGRFGEAERTYAKVYEQYPGTLSAYVARVAAGSLRVDHLGDPAGAKRLFQAALRAAPGGALDIEARQGVADAARRLGDAAGERQALRGIVEKHPKSRAASLARERLKGI